MESAVRNVLALMAFCLSITSGAQEGSVQTEESIDQQVEAVTQSSESKSGTTSSEVAPSAPSEELLAGEMKNLKEGSITSKPENEVPVLASATAEKTSQQDPMSRLLLSLGVVMGVALSLLLVAKFWSKRKTGLKQHHQIKVLTQFSMGPKKSLAIVRVAGESILIGVTDHNISMIKSLSLIDDELPEMSPQHFDGELHRVDQSEEDFSFASVNDRVSRSTQQMRSL